MHSFCQSIIKYISFRKRLINEKPGMRQYDSVFTVIYHVFSLLNKIQISVCKAKSSPRSVSPFWSPNFRFEQERQIKETQEGIKEHFFSLGSDYAPRPVFALSFK